MNHHEGSVVGASIAITTIEAELAADAAADTAADAADAADAARDTNGPSLNLTTLQLTTEKALEQDSLQAGETTTHLKGERRDATHHLGGDIDTRLGHEARQQDALRDRAWKLPLLNGKRKEASESDPTYDTNRGAATANGKPASGTAGPPTTSAAHRAQVIDIAGNDHSVRRRAL